MAGNESKCAAYNCENYQEFCPNLSFHRFPKVNANKKESYERCKKWLINCRRDDLDDLFNKDQNYLYRNCRVCSNHFEDSCYKDPLIKVLKNDAVPTKFDVADVPNQPPSSVPRRKPLKQRLRSPSPSDAQNENETIIISGPSPEVFCEEFSIKMAAPLETCTKEEQRSVIRFLDSEDMKPSQIHRRMKAKYGAACLSLQQVYEWSRKFRKGVSSVSDLPRPGPAHRAVTPAAIAAIEALVKEDQSATLDQIATKMGISHGSAHRIVRDELKLKKDAKVGRWVKRKRVVKSSEKIKSVPGIKISPKLWSKSKEKEKKAFVLGPSS